MAEKYYKGDDFGAFDENWVEINLDYPEEWIISKVGFKVGNLPTMNIEDPEFPLYINLTSEQTAGLKDVNTCYLAVYDAEGNKRTCEGSWTFVAADEVVN